MGVKRMLLPFAGVLWLSLFALFSWFANRHIAAGVLDWSNRKGVDLSQPTLWAIAALANWRWLALAVVMPSGWLIVRGRTCFAISMGFFLPLIVVLCLLFALSLPLHWYGIVV